MAEEKTIDVEYVSKLARIELTKEESQKFAEQLDQIMEYFRKLDTVDVANVDPTAHAFPVFNIWQEDVAVSGFSVEEALRNVPEARDNQVVVPKVVEGA